MDVTPTKFYDLEGRKTSSYQFSLSHQSNIHHGNPMINFRWELSPLAVVYHQKRPDIVTFIINLCAVVGGFISVASLLESFIRNLFRDGTGEGESRFSKPKTTDLQRAVKLEKQVKAAKKIGKSDDEIVENLSNSKMETEMQELTC